jgi:hypothetical protein
VRKGEALAASATSPVLYVGRVAGSGVELFDVVWARDMGGMVAPTGCTRRKRPRGSKIENPTHPQAEGCVDLFDAMPVRV